MNKTKRELMLEKKVNELKSKLITQADLIAGAIISLDKAGILLWHWQNEYLFDRNPEPQSATYHPGEAFTPLMEISLKWYMEYDKIVQFINIASDYVCDTKKQLQTASPR